MGAIATQARVNPYLGIDGLELLAQGLPAEEVVRRLTESDPGRDVRQLGVVDREGRSAAWTGKDCAPGAATSPATASPRRATC